MNTFILLVVLTLGSKDGKPAMQTLQYGPYFDYRTCSEIGKLTIENLKSDIKSKDFEAGYTCVQRNDIPAQMKKK